MIEEGAEIVYGSHPVFSALSNKKRRVRTVFTASSPDKRMRKLAGDAGADLIVRSRRFLDKITGAACHQGVVAVMGTFNYGDMDDMGGLIEILLSKGETPLFVLLDCVQDPRNVGAIIRSTLELGGHGVVLPERRSAGITPAAVKSSAGATEALPVFRVSNLNPTIEYLARYGLIFVAAVEDGVPPQEIDLSVPTALVLGSEGRGVRPSVRKRCQYQVTIPISGVIGSLNVSVAGGILLAEISRQRLNL